MPIPGSMKQRSGLGAILALICAEALALGLAIVLQAPTWILLGLLCLGTALALWGVLVQGARQTEPIEPIRRAVARLRQAAGLPADTPENPWCVPGAIDEATQRLRLGADAELSIRARVEGVLQSLEQPLIVTDAAGNVTLLNHAAEKFVGVSAERLMGRGIDEVLTWSDLLQLHERAREGRVVREQVRLNRPDGARVLDVLVRSAPTAGEPGQRTIVMVLVDVTEHARSLQVKADFVANASHELRTPIAAMRVAIDTIEALDNDDAQTRARFMAVLSANIERLEELVRDLLDLSRLESAEAGIEHDLVSASQLAAALAPGFERSCAERDLALVWELDPELERMRTDRKLLLLILQNLIDNSTKFAFQGTQIRIVGRPMPPASGQPHDGPLSVRFEVIDQGIGIPLGQQSRVFERFYQVDAARTGAGPARRGTGLGLSIVKHAVKRLGGTIRVDSVWKVGTRMIVDLPGILPPLTPEARTSVA